MEIVKSFVNDNKDPRLYLSYYRDINQKEIDLVISMNGKVYPIEIKKSKSPSKGGMLVEYLIARVNMQYIKWR